MAASAVQNPSTKSESKSSKKKKAPKQDSIAATPTETATTPTAEVPTPTGAEAGSVDGSYESPYIKELYKNIRNVNKKITNASKVDNILAENPNMSLDDLVATRKINADQKAQILKKPQLQASLTQLEDQIAQYKKFDQEYKARSQTEKAEFEKTFTEKSAKELAEAVAAIKAEAAAEASKQQHSNLLLVSQFLRLAAARRAEEADQSLDENQALEGVLLSVYSGDESAVATMIKLINGSEENTYSVNGEELKTTYAQVRAAIVASTPPAAPEVAEEEPLSTPPAEATEYAPQSDPTLAHAASTELDAEPLAAMVNGATEQASGAETADIPQNSGIDEGAANATAGSHWDQSGPADMSASQEWVDVGRDPAETDTGLTSTIGTNANTQSWADDQPEEPKVEAIPAGNDGFHEVQRTRGGRDREGQYRGRGGHGGDGRGRGGFRGNDGGYRGRGRGGPRGGGPRGPKPEASQ